MSSGKLIRHDTRTISIVTLLIVAVTSVTVYIHHAGWLRPFETPALDMVLNIFPIPTRNVFVVGITDDDYQKLFKEHSPLEADLVSKLIAAIATGNPEVIVVDLDVAANLDELQKKLNQTKVVWARAVRPGNSDFSPGIKSDLSNVILTRSSDLQNSQGVIWGLSLFPEDDDGVVRHYFRQVSLSAGAGKDAAIYPTLPWKAVQAFRGNPDDQSVVEIPKMVLGFAGGDGQIPRISATDMLAVSGKAGWRETVKGKIVLLGGYYSAARDSYVTPVGRLAGVELNANAIETELHRGGILPISDTALAAMLFASGILLVFLNSIVSRVWIAFIALLAVPIVAMLCSLLLFDRVSLWIDFIPVLVAVQLYFIATHLVSVHRQNLALTASNKALAETKNELAMAINSGAERERKHLAHELHDDILGQLSEVALRLQTAGKEQEETNKVVSTIRSTMDSIRRIVSGLYPSVLERYGLIDGINDLFDRAGRSDLELEIIDETDGTCASFDKPTQLALFRIIQESLNNTLKHSGATKVILQLSVSEGKLLIIYSDNGKGIAQDSGAKPDSFGISSMRRRAEMLHAQIEWRSPPAASFGTGTEVRVEMPLPATAVATCKSE